MTERRRASLTDGIIGRQVSVYAPATSANLGPGFDSIGLALSLGDVVTAEEIAAGLLIDVTGEGAELVARDEGHLVYRAMDAAFEQLDWRPTGLRLTCRNRIPHGRGLGSSAAAIIAGVMLARELVPQGRTRLDDHGVLQLATKLEGHPDNVAAALYGGLTIAWVDGAVADVVRLDSDVDVTVFIPPDAVSTKAARSLLPQTVSHQDAAFNAGRAALLIAALTSDLDRLLPATEERLHQCFRADVMPESSALLQSLRDDGVPAVISGAGPSVLAFAHGLGDAVPAGWRTLELTVDRRGARVTSEITPGATT